MFNDVKDLKQGLPQTYRVGVGGGGEEWGGGGWIKPKFILRYFKTILRQNLLFSVAVHFNAKTYFMIM